MQAIPDVLSANIPPDKRIGHKFKIDAITMATDIVPDDIHTVWPPAVYAISKKHLVIGIRPYLIVFDCAIPPVLGQDAVCVVIKLVVLLRHTITIHQQNTGETCISDCPELIIRKPSSTAPFAWISITFPFFPPSITGKLIPFKYIALLSFISFSLYTPVSTSTVSPGCALLIPCWIVLTGCPFPTYTLPATRGFCTPIKAITIPRTILNVFITPLNKGPAM